MKFKITVLLLTFSFFVSKFSLAQWQILNGPYGIETSSTVLFDSVFYAGTSNGLAVSHDTSQYWALDSLTISGAVSMLVFKEGKFIHDRTVNTQGGFLSLDSGKTWTQMSSTGLNYPQKYDISLGNIYVWGSYGFLYYSIDNGQSWITIPQPPSSNNTNDFAVDNGRIYVVKGLFGSGVSNTYYSDDFGSSWHILPSNGISGATLAPDQIIPLGGTLFLFANNRIYKSIDSGNTWNYFETGLGGGYCCTNRSIRMRVSKDKIYVTGTNNFGLFVSDISSPGFTNISNGLPKEIFISSVTEHNDFLYASSASGLFRTNKNIINWQPANNGLSLNNCFDIASIDSTVLLGTNNAFHVSHNNGNSFTSIPVATTTNSFIKSSNKIIAATARGYESTDGGYTWTSLNYTYTGQADNLIDFCQVPNYYFGLNNSLTVKSSANGGGTWDVLSGIPANTAQCLLSNNGVLFVGTSNGIYKSSNQGNSFTVVLPGESVSRIRVDNGILYALTSNSVWISLTNGITWADTHYPGVNAHSLTVHNGMLIVSPGLYYTKDLGANWNLLPSPTGAIPFSAFAVCLNSSYLYAFNSQTLYRMDAALITKVVSPEIESDSWAIYPNPVQDNLNVHILSDELIGKNIEMKIYNVTGRVVIQELIENNTGKLPLVNVALFPSGIYFIKLESSEINSKAYSSKKFVIY